MEAAGLQYVRGCEVIEIKDEGENVSRRWPAALSTCQTAAHHAPCPCITFSCYRGQADERLQRADAA
jgi:hypothetical protein